MSDPNTGRKISNRYELIEPVGQGSMGKVYLAGDSLLGGVPVAVKFLSQTLLNENMRDRFFREAMTCAQLGQKSMHVVRVTDYGVNEEDIPFYVMEYLKGKSVGAMIRQKPLPVPQFLGLVRQILLGLKTAHNGILVKGEVVPIIHRDIKPSNILVTSDPSMGELVKILDFGIAKLLQAGSKQTSTFMGTLAYASPEQMEGRELDNRSDIYSLGVMMYQMLSGNLPVKPVNNTFGSWYKVHRIAEPKPLSEFDLELKVPKALEDIVLCCLAKQRENRPANVDSILDAITPLENRFNSGFHISQRINSALSKVPLVGKTADKVLADSAAADNAIANSAIANSAVANSAVQAVLESGQAQESASSQPSSSSFSSLANDLASSHSPVSVALRQALHPAEDRFYLEQVWPADKPVAQIVFPRVLSPESEKAPTLWAMMPTDEIEKRVRHTRYNNFMCTMAPHPMVLWLTAFYHKAEGPRWLPCYLDLKTASAQNILRALAEARQYRILFFTKESPNQCTHVRKLNVAASQRKLFKEWVTTAGASPSVGDPKDSKALLKRELENNLKPKIVMNFEAMHSDLKPGIDASLGF